jgi:hypothetical protein
LEKLVVSDNRAQLQFALWAEKSKTAHKPASWPDHFRDPTYTRGPTKETLGSPTTSQLLPKLWTRRDYIYFHTAQHSNLEKAQEH